MLATPRSIGDIINAIVAAGVEPLEGSVDSTGLTIIADGRPVRIAFLTEPNRFDANQFELFAMTSDAYDRQRRTQS
jgi:hypothetical protein